MGNIREYITGNNNREHNIEKSKEKEKYTTGKLTQRIIQHRFRIFVRTLLIVIVLMAVVVATVSSIRNRIYEGYQVVSSAERSGLMDAACVEYSGNILTYSRDGASCTDIRGVALWNQTFEMQSPIMDMEGDKVAFGDYNGTEIYVMDTTGLISKINTMMPLRDFCVAENGMVVAVLDDGSVTWIYLYDTEGGTIAYFKTHMYQSGYPVSVAVSPTGRMVQVSFVYVESGYMRSSVAFYNFGSVGENQIDNFVSGYDYLDTVVPFVRFLDNDTAIAVGDSRLMLYKGAQIPASSWEKLLTEEIQAVYYSQNYIGLVYYDVSGEETYRMDIYATNGEIAESLKFSIAYTDILFQNDRVIIYDEKECLIHNIGRGDVISTQFDKGVLALIPTSAFNRYVLVSADSIDTIELK